MLATALCLIFFFNNTFVYRNIVVIFADQETTDPLPTGAETLCLLQVEDLLGAHLGSHEEDPHRLTTGILQFLVDKKYGRKSGILPPKCD